MENSATLERYSKIIFCKVSYSGLHSKVFYIFLMLLKVRTGKELVSVHFGKSLPLWLWIQYDRQALNTNEMFNIYKTIDFTSFPIHKHRPLRILKIFFFYQLIFEEYLG